jgi:DNA-binding beta-propeller fold protein YncE
LIPCLALWIGCSRAHSQAASTASTNAEPLQFLKQWGVRGTDPGQFEDPVGPAMDPVGRVYIADRATGFVQKFEASGVPLLSFEAPAARTADAIAVDSGGAIYIANFRTGIVQIFFPQGQPLHALRIAPQRGVADPFFFSIDAEGKIYVPDAAHSRLHILSSRGLQRILTVPGNASQKLGHPFAAVANIDAVYVGDAEDGRILKFSRTGGLIATFQNPDPAGASRLLSLAVSGKHVFALRGFPLRLEIWSEDGQRQVANALADRLSAVKSAAYLAANAAGDLVVLDPEARRVLHFRAHVDLR